jgi:uncharacterized membrane protein
MILLIVGLVLFLGAHSVRIFAARWREAVIARLGPGPWKGLYSAVAGVGFVLLIAGYGQARGAPPLWSRLAGAEHATAALVLIGFILLAAAYAPRNHIKAAVRDPMVLGVGAWALGHLIVKASAPALALFGGFLAWAILDFISLRLRPAAPAAASPAAPTLAGTAAAIVVGAALFAVFAFWAHGALIGVRPFG